MTLVTATAVILTLRAAHDVAKVARESNDPDTLRSAIHDLSHQISEALSDALYLQAQVIDLKARADGASRQAIWHFASESEKNRYTRIASRGGAFVYVEKRLAHDPELSPEYCAGCFEIGTRAMLKPIGVGGIAKCPSCGAAPRTGRG